jgi:hypothetical protein
MSRKKPVKTAVVTGAHRGILWLATLPDGSPNGGLFRDRQPMSW